MKHTPRTAETLDEIATLGRDNLDIGAYWMVIDEEAVSLAHQFQGQPAENVLTVPRSTFNRFIDWYNTGIEPTDILGGNTIPYVGNRKEK